VVSLFQTFHLKSCTHFLSTHSCIVSCQCHPPSFHHLNNMCWRVQIIKLSHLVALLNNAQEIWLKCTNLLSNYQITSLLKEFEGSSPLIPQPATGHDPELAPSHILVTYFPVINLIVIFPPLFRFTSVFPQEV